MAPKNFFFAGPVSTPIRGGGHAIPFGPFCMRAHARALPLRLGVTLFDAGTSHFAHHIPSHISHFRAVVSCIALSHFPSQRRQRLLLSLLNCSGSFLLKRLGSFLSPWGLMQTVHCPIKQFSVPINRSSRKYGGDLLRYIWPSLVKTLLYRWYQSSPLKVNSFQCRLSSST